MGFRSNTKVSEPSDDAQFTLIKDMNGFGWDPDHGIFIPAEQQVDYFTKPHITDLLREISI
jgi:hypothetical protein